jgi:hypothetical protein
MLLLDRACARGDGDEFRVVGSEQRQDGLEEDEHAEDLGVISAQATWVSGKSSKGKTYVDSPSSLETCEIHR